jgi:hypothetical protein
MRATLSLAWSGAETSVDGDIFTFPALNAPISVQEIYDNILDAAGRSLLR